jgi:hypothetical protein
MTIPTNTDDTSTQLSFFDEKPDVDGGLVASKKTGLALRQTEVSAADYVAID